MELPSLATCLLPIALCVEPNSFAEALEKDLLSGGSAFDQTFQHASAVNGSTCCALLEKELGSRVAFTVDKGYKSSLDSYWSERETQLQPSCVVHPDCPTDVAKVVRILSSLDSCKFAVRGGGHTGWAGAANICDGVTIDLSSLNRVSVSDDKKVTSVGGGARWGDVYKYLDDRNLAVAGGRLSSVGVGGLTLGGGISFLSPKVGFVCDNVVSYQLVMADGEIEDISESNKPDLFRALKGGHNNFGIMTTVRLKTYPGGPIWGGIVSYDISTSREQTKAFKQLARTNADHPNGAFVQSYIYGDWAGGQPGIKGALSNLFAYTKVPAKNETPSYFADAIKAAPTLTNDLKVQQLPTLTGDIYPPLKSVPRRMLATFSFYLDDSPYMDSAIALFHSYAQTQLTALPKSVFALTIQAIPQAAESTSSHKSNVLGLNPKDGIIINFCVYPQWAGKENDEVIIKGVKDAIGKAVEMAKEAGVYAKYLYLNYAEKWQDPIAGYGQEEVEFLRNVSKKYDPRGVFQKQMPGGFKLWTGKGTG